MESVYGDKQKLVGPNHLGMKRALCHRKRNHHQVPPKCAWLLDACFGKVLNTMGNGSAYSVTWSLQFRWHMGILWFNSEESTAYLAILCLGYIYITLLYGAIMNDKYKCTYPESIESDFNPLLSPSKESVSFPCLLDRDLNRRILSIICKII